MDNVTVDLIIAEYALHKNLKIVGTNLNIPWQTVYWHLKKNSVPVTGDKERYGSVSDMVGFIGEKLFSQTIPEATNQNTFQFQSKYDFIYKNLNIDVKTSLLKTVSNKVEGSTSERWAFSFSKQPDVDVLVCYCLVGTKEVYCVEHILLIPRDLLTIKHSISVTKGNSKWLDFKISEDELIDFFERV